MKMRFHLAGATALLCDIAHGGFDDAAQRRIWVTARAVERHQHVISAIPGVNNLLVGFDGLHTGPEAIRDVIAEAWEAATDVAVSTREVRIQVAYGGALGEDLADVAAQAGLSVRETIAVHAAGIYRVAAIGAMPGFVYLTGLDGRLCVPRRDTPRVHVPRGAVILGGGHAGVMPCDAPSGWHMVGATESILFDVHRDEPCLLRMGDVVRFDPVA
ncbi:MAG: 5-oxoprolinase subunit PxpB [Gluconacetobacter liquefaciens]